MHENIKYTVVLDETISPIIKSKDTSIDTSNYAKEELANWQCVYGDIAYGTHFYVYAKFIGVQNGANFNVTKIQLYLQNYSGPVSLGFTNFININEVDMLHGDPDQDEDIPNKKKYYLEFGLRGMNMGNNFIQLDKNITLNDHDIIVSEPMFSPIRSSLTKIFDSAQHRLADYVDELFMTRVGEDIVITEEGKARLEKLNRYQHFDEHENELISLLENEKLKDIAQRDLSEIESKNIKWPCKPRNASVRVMRK